MKTGLHDFKGFFKGKTYKDILTMAKKSALYALPPTIIITGIFFLNYFCFGPENASIGPVTALLFNKYRTRNGRYECLIMDFLVCEVLALAAFAAGINIVISVIVNAAVFFWLACFYINDYSPANHFPVGIAYIFFQISPASSALALGTRAAALLVSFALLMVFLIVYTVLFTDYPAYKKIITEGFENCSEQLKCRSAAARGCADAADTDAHSEPAAALHGICLRCCREIWEFNRSVIRPRNRSNYYCRYVSFFIIFSYLMQGKAPGSFEQAVRLYGKYRSEFDETKPRAVYRRQRVRMDPLSLSDFRVRFALRETIVLVPLIVFASLSGLQNVWWMVLCAFFLITPYSDLAADKVKRRVAGTVLGVLLCQIAFPLLNNFTGRAVLMTVANFFSFFGGGYDMAVICITCAVTALSEIEGAISVMLLQRLVYNLIGCFVAVLANRFIFPVRTVDNLNHSAVYAERLQDEIEALAREIKYDEDPGAWFALGKKRPETGGETDASAASRPVNGGETEARPSRPSGEDLRRDAENRREIDQRLVRLFLLQGRMEELDATLPPEDRRDYIIKKHRDRMLSIAGVFAEKMLGH